MTPNFPHDSIWPTNPPRVETYCNASMVSHPLVSPLFARSASWEGAPPVYVCVGWDGMQDEAEVFARRVAEAGATVLFEGFVGMPHAFGMVPWSKSGFRAFDGWAGFCRAVVGGELQGSEGSACWVDKVGTVRRTALRDLGLKSDESVYMGRIPLDDKVVSEFRDRSKAWRVRDEAIMRFT